MNRCLALGADYIATGHYARVVQLENGRYALAAAPSSKDQTYALYNLTQEQLSHTLMPVGTYTKDEIRSFAQNIDIRVSKNQIARIYVLFLTGSITNFWRHIQAERFPMGIL